MTPQAGTIFPDIRFQAGAACLPRIDVGSTSTNLVGRCR
jgi:hypothetical protein